MFFYSGQSGALYDEETDSVRTAYFWLVSEPKKHTEPTLEEMGEEYDGEEIKPYIPYDM